MTCWRARLGAIDETRNVDGAMGMSLIGVRAIADIPSMTTLIAYELMFNHAIKLRHTTGGQATLPMRTLGWHAGLVAISGGAARRRRT
jgi:pyruvate/2-oxoglutarate/acetoin dehydrogenase E1 component